MRNVKAPPAYDATNEQQFRAATEDADGQNVKKGTDINLRGGRPNTRNPRIIYYSPSGFAFYIAVADDGTLSTVEL